MDPCFHGTRSFGKLKTNLVLRDAVFLFSYPTNFFYHPPQMMPGLAFLYAGLLHKRSAVTMIMQNFASVGVIFILVRYFPC